MTSVSKLAFAARFLPAIENVLATGLSLLVAVFVLAPMLAVVLAAVDDGDGHRLEGRLRILRIILKWRAGPRRGDDQNGCHQSEMLSHCDELRAKDPWSELGTPAEISTATDA